MTSLTDAGKNMTEDFTGELTGPVACPRTDSFTVKYIAHTHSHTNTQTTQHSAGPEAESRVCERL